MDQDGSPERAGPAATPGAFWRGLRLVSMDGSLFDVPGSKANAAAYTREANGGRPGPFPQVRLLALVECGTKAVIGAVFDSFAIGERTLGPTGCWCTCAPGCC